MAPRLRRKPSRPGACSQPPRKPSMTQTEDLPEPTGPMQQRMKASESRNSESVGGASYLIGISGKRTPVPILRRDLADALLDAFALIPQAMGFFHEREPGRADTGFRRPA